MFSGCTVPPNSKETELGSSNQEASPSAGRNTVVVLVSCSQMEVRSYSYFRWCGYFWGPWMSFVTTNEFSVKVSKNYFKDLCLMNSQPIFVFLIYLNLMNYEHIIKSIYEHSRPFFEFCRLRIFPWIKLSLHSCSMWDKPEWLNWFWKFLCEKLSSFNLKGF